MLTKCYSTASVTSKGRYTGGLAGVSTNITDCYATGAIQGGHYVGGLVGYCELGNISNCYATGAVGSVGSENVGGLVGAAYSDATVKNCVALNPQISGGAGTTYYTHRVIGSAINETNDETKFPECYAFDGMIVNGDAITDNTAAREGKNLSYTGSALSPQLSTVFQNNAAWTFNDNKLPILSDVGGGQSRELPEHITATANKTHYIFTAAELAKLAKDVNGGADKADHTYYLAADISLDGYKVSGYLGKDYPNGWVSIGTETTPFKGVFDGQGHTISSMTIDVAATNNLGVFGYVAGNTAQLKNITVSNAEIKNATGDNVGAVVGYYDSPLALTNCAMEGGSITGKDNVGGVVGNVATSDVTQCYATGAVNGGSNVGGVAGTVAKGGVTECYATGDVTASGSNVGGVAGNVVGNVSKCYATGGVTASGSKVGGVVGDVGTGNVSECYATGNVTVNGSGSIASVGGVAGYASGGVKNCYATGDITIGGSFETATNIGGVVGDISAESEVIYCYATGAIDATDKGSSFVGGISGTDSLKVSDCVALNPSIKGYNSACIVRVANDDTSNKLNNNYAYTGMTINGNVVENCDAYSDTRGKNGKNFIKQDGTLGPQFSAVFDDDKGTANPEWEFTDDRLPVLKNVGGVQSSTLPGYMALTNNEISTAAQLAELAAQVNAGNDMAGKTFKLMADIKISAYYAGAKVDGVTYTNGWIPIGDGQIITTDTEGANKVAHFAGVFDGQGYTITGLSISGTETERGLFGYVKGDAAAIKNLKLADVSVSGRVNVGGIAGHVEFGSIEKCSVSGKIYGKAEGNSSGAVLGGVVGKIYDGSINRCCFYGSVINNNSLDISQYCGGIVGEVTTSATTSSETTLSEIANCYSAGGSIEGQGKNASSAFGGIAGRIDGAVLIKNCYTTSTIKDAAGYVGGIVGFAEGVGRHKIQSCVVLSDSITGGASVGYVIGAVGYGENNAKTGMTNGKHFVLESIKKKGNSTADSDWKPNLIATKGGFYKLSEDPNKIYGVFSWTDIHYDPTDPSFPEKDGWIIPAYPELPTIDGVSVEQPRYSASSLAEQPNETFTATLADDTTSIVYDSKEKKPELTIKYGDKQLCDGYSVVWSNNRDAGDKSDPIEANRPTATITADGIGTIKVYFTIEKADVTVAPKSYEKFYTNPDPKLEYTTNLTPSPVLNGELGRDPGEDAKEAGYAITQGTITNKNNPNYNITFIEGKKLTIKKAPANVSLDVSPKTQKVGREVTITVTAKHPMGTLAAGYKQPNGVTLKTNTGETINLIANPEVDGGWTGTYTPKSVPTGGTIEFTATLNDTSGNYDNDPFSSKKDTLTVVDKGVVTVDVTPKNEIISYGESVIYTATVTKNDSTDTDALSGKVQFYLDSGSANAQPIGAPKPVTDTDSVSVTLDKAQLTAGEHKISAKYSGNDNFAAAEGETTTTVNTATPSVTLEVSSGEHTYGDSITLTANVKRIEGGTTPAGTVTFMNGSTAIEADIALTDGTASFDWKPTASTAGHSVTAKYVPKESGDNYASGVSTAQTVVVAKKPVTLNVKISDKVYNSNNKVSLTDIVLTAPEGSILSGDVDTLAASGNAVYPDKNVGAHTVSLDGVTVTATGTNSENYEFILPKTADAKINRYPITVTVGADNKKAYGEKDPEFVYSTNGALFDLFEGTLVRDSGEAVSANYEIKQGTLTNENNPNYDISFTGGYFEIEQAEVALNATASPASQKAGGWVTITVTAVNSNASATLANGCEQPRRVTLETADGNSIIPLTDKGNGTWEGRGQVPADAAVGSTQNFAVSVSDSNYKTPDKKAAEVTVTDKGPVNVTIEADKTTGVVYGDSITYTAKVTKYDANDHDTLDGTVQFYLDSGSANAKPIGEPQPVANTMSVTLDKTQLTAGEHEISAAYSGNKAFSEASQSTTTNVSQKLLSFDVTELSAANKDSDDTLPNATLFGTLKISGVLSGDEVVFECTADKLEGVYDDETAGKHTVNLWWKGGSPVSLTGAQAANYELPEAIPTIIGKITEKLSGGSVISPDDGNAYRVEIEGGLSSVPEALKKLPELNTPAKIEDFLRKALGQNTDESMVVFDAELQISTDDGETWQTLNADNFPEGGIDLILPYDEEIADDYKSYEFTVLHMISHGDRAGEIEDINVIVGVDGLRAHLNSLSPIAISWKKIENGGNGGGGGSDGGDSDDTDSRDGEYEFWQQIASQLRKATSGSTITAEAKGFDHMSRTVMEALQSNTGVSLVIEWNGGKTITIPAGKALVPEANRIYYPLAYLAQQYQGTALPTAAAGNINPTTGGKNISITAPAKADALGTAVTDAARGVAETAELAAMGVEREIPVAEENNQIAANNTPAAHSSMAGLWFAMVIIAVMGGAYLLCRKKSGAR